MQLITDEYRALNATLHEKNKEYGVSGVYYLKDVVRLIKAHQTQDILDYGCGKGTLSMNLPFTIAQYDPAIKKHSALPKPADIVVCTDVLEHIEPELIDNVLKHIASLTKKTAYLVACTIPAKKTLADGRNAHILVKPRRWWIDKLHEHFDLDEFKYHFDNAIFVVKPKEKTS